MIAQKKSKARQKTKMGDRVEKGRGRGRHGGS